MPFRMIPIEFAARAGDPTVNPKSKLQSFAVAIVRDALESQRELRFVHVPIAEMVVPSRIEHIHIESEFGTPIDLRKVVDIAKPAVRVRYDLDILPGYPSLEDILRPVLG